MFLSRCPCITIDGGNSLRHRFLRLYEQIWIWCDDRGVVSVSIVYHEIYDLNQLWEDIKLVCRVKCLCESKCVTFDVEYPWSKNLHPLKSDASLFATFEELDGKGQSKIIKSFTVTMS